MIPLDNDLKPLEGAPPRLYWLTVRNKQNLADLMVKLDLGMTKETAYQIASEEIDRLYQQACLLEQVPPVNNLLDPTAVRMQARFALDAAMIAARAGMLEGEVRKQFWAIFGKVTNPTSTS